MGRHWISIGVAMVSTAACGGSAMLEAGGARYEVSSAEANLAHDLDLKQPSASAPSARCDYWTSNAAAAASWSQDKVVLGFVGVAGEKDERSPGFKAWTQAKQNEACAGEAKRKADEEAAAESARETQREAARRQARTFAAAEAEKKRAAAQAEIDAGRCSDANHATLDAALSQYKSIFEQPSRFDTWLLVAHEFVVATDEGAHVVFRPAVAGEYHVLALGTGAARLDVRDENGYASTQRSVRGEPMLANLSSDMAHDTRVVQANAGAKYEITVRGAGCALVMAFDKL